MNPATTAAEISGDPAIPSAVEMTSTTPELTQPTSPSTKSTRRRRKSKRRRTTGGVYLPEMLTHSSGQGRCIIKGKTYYLGPYDSEESHERLDELRRRLLNGDPELLNPVRIVTEVRTIKDLVDAFWTDINSRNLYTKLGEETSQRPILRAAFSQFMAMFPHLLARKVRDDHLKEWRRTLLARQDLSLGGINRKVGYLRQLMEWGVEEKILPKSVLTSVRELQPLKQKSVGERPVVSRKRRALDDDEILKVLPHLSRAVQGLIRFQLATGCRPGEATALRMVDIDMNPPKLAPGMWRYKVLHPKTEHHGRHVSYVLNAEARALVLEHASGPAGYVFSWRGKRICTEGYSKMIAKACHKAGVPRWSAHELRHTALSRIYARMGIVAACAVACHSSTRTTEKYLHLENVVDKSQFVADLGLPRAAAQA